MLRNFNQLMPQNYYIFCYVATIISLNSIKHPYFSCAMCGIFCNFALNKIETTE